MPSWTLGWSRVRCPRVGISLFGSGVHGFLSECKQEAAQHGFSLKPLGRGCIKVSGVSGIEFDAISMLFC